MAAILEAKNLVVKRDETVVLEVPHLAIREGELLAVIGPNGAGKSTLLMALSQLLPYSTGEITFLGKKLKTSDRLAFRRQIGMVLQEPFLLDTSVSENVATGMQFRKIPKEKIRKKTQYWLDQLGIQHLVKRKARNLSGGEAQRVSLARALALEPKILFLDEPFSALDAPTRAKLITDFQRLQREQHLTTLFVTHDLDEALLLGDRVAVVMGGSLRQVNDPHTVFTAPIDAEVAHFVGVETIITGEVRSEKDGLIEIKSNGFTLEAVGKAVAGSAVFVCLRPEDITLWLQDQPVQSSARNRLSGRITQILPQGPLDRVVIDCGFPLVALVTRTSSQEMGLGVDKKVTASFKASAVHLIDRG